jgi:putative ABC transport system ATP-binding protein
MITKPTVIFADEPTGALDSASGTALLRFLRHSVDKLGQTVVMVTHDAQAASFADRIIRLADGHVVADERRK